MAYPNQPTDGAGKKFVGSGLANNGGVNEFRPAASVNRRTQNGEIVADPTVDITTSSGLGAAFGDQDDAAVNWDTDASAMARLRKISAALETLAGQATYTTPTHTQPTIATTTTVALASNTNRKYALLVNDSDTTIYLKFGASAVLNQGIRLAANGGSYEMSKNLGNVYTGAINAIHAGTGTKVLLVTEGV